MVLGQIESRCHRLGTDLVVTLDRRHFGTVLSPAGQRFRLLPEVVMAHEDLAPYPRPEP